MTEAEIAWLAGFLEGEGTFYIKNQPNRQYFIPIIKVGGTDRDVIQYAARLLGGPPLQFERRRRDHWKDQWKIHVYGQRAVEVMRQVLPWMGERRAAKIQEVITAWEARPQKPKMKSTPKLSSEVRRWAHQQGMRVADRGRIPFEVWEAFRAVDPVDTASSVL